MSPAIGRHLGQNSETYLNQSTRLNESSWVWQRKPTADLPFVSQKEEVFFSDRCYHGREDWGLGHTAALSRLECAVLHYPETSFIEWCPRTLRGGDTVLGTGNVRWDEVSVFPPSFSAGTSAGDSRGCIHHFKFAMTKPQDQKQLLGESTYFGLCFQGRRVHYAERRGSKLRADTFRCRESEQYDLKGHLQ